MAAITLTGNCQIHPPTGSGRSIGGADSRAQATVAHYLGIIVPVLLAQPPSDDERAHRLRFAIGAGVEPELHRAAEERFGFPVNRGQGTAEMVRVIADHPPRREGNSNVPSAPSSTDRGARTDDAGGEVADGTPGSC